MFMPQSKEALQGVPGAVTHDVHGVSPLPNLVGRCQRSRLFLRLRDKQPSTNTQHTSSNHALHVVENSFPEVSSCCCTQKQHWPRIVNFGLLEQNASLSSLTLLDKSPISLIASSKTLESLASKDPARMMTAQNLSLVMLLECGSPNHVQCRLGEINAI